MADTFIPAGRTSMVKTGGLSLQVQTEYAGNPSPRITTTILQDGQVLHKVQRDLDNPIQSIEGQNKTEQNMVKQHGEIISILKSGKATHALKLKLSEKDEVKSSPAIETLRGIPGVRGVYKLDGDGNFVGVSSSEQFQETFGALFKNLRQLLSLFLPDPKEDGTREKSVHEIEANRLYLISEGDACYFVIIDKSPESADYHEKIRRVIFAVAIT